jgi:hypothetical protein
MNYRMVMIKKYTLATLLNWKISDIGNQDNQVYLVVLILLLVLSYSLEACSPKTKIRVIFY